MLMAFQEEPDEYGRIPVDCPQFLISTYAVAGTGITATRAFRVALLDPDFSTNVEQQAIYRISRKSQQNPRTFSYRFICPLAAVEMRMLEVQDKRARFQTPDFDGDWLTDGLEQQCISGLKEDDRSGSIV